MEKKLQEQLDYANLHGYALVEDKFEFPPYLTAKAGKYNSEASEESTIDFRRVPADHGWGDGVSQSGEVSFVFETNSAKD